MQRTENLERFLTLCENSAFTHRDELLRGIKADEYLLERYSRSEVPSNQLFDIYSVRAKILGERIRTNELNGISAKRLLSDTEAFVSELEEVSDEKINFWSFSINESSSYHAFEGINSERILGCLLTVDKRETSEAEWNRLWGKAEL